MPKRILTIIVMLHFVAIIALAESANALRQRLTPKTDFGTIRRLFLNQKIIVTGDVVHLRGDVLADWAPARRAGTGRYMAPSLDKLSSIYKDKVAEVIGLQLHGLQRRFRPKLGDFIYDDDTMNPYFDLIVRFRDGTMAICTSYPETILNNIEFGSKKTDP